MSNTKKHKPASPHASEGAIEIIDPNLRRGFAQVPRPVIKAKGLSSRSKVLYTLLLDYAWDSSHCFPGQKRLADDLDTTVRTVQRALTELREYGLISWRRIGVMKPNVYSILPLSGCSRLELTKPSKSPTPSEATKLSRHEATKTPGHEATRMSHKEDPLENTQTEENPEHKTSKIRKEAVPETEEAVDSQPAYPETAETPLQSMAEILSEHQPGPAKSRPRPEVLDEDYQRIQDCIEDRAREFNDTAPLKSSTTRAWRLYKRSGVSVEEFTNRVYQARSITRERTAAIKSTTADPRYGRQKTKMAYFFAVLEDHLGLAERKDEGTRARTDVPDEKTDEDYSWAVQR